jgi:hypothetical protein
VIKMITKQYVPIDGYCTIDLVETWTGVLWVECLDPWAQCVSCGMYCWDVVHHYRG